VEARSVRNAARRASRPTPDRLRFVLDSPSRAIDHKHNAARRDLADIALAGRWFAPHYAVPESWTCVAPAELHSSPGAKDEVIGSLSTGDRFAVLEVSATYAWGYREQDRLVGYVEAGALRPDGEPS
jgi:hypothetical protein